jgi:hypothetical protein
MFSDGQKGIMMFPLNGAMFIPSLFVTPSVLAVAFIWRRKSETYPRFWWTVVVICFLLTASLTAEIMAAPLYGERRPSNPDAFPGGGLFAVLTMLLAGTCLVIPSFSVLIGLAFLSPRNLRITWRSVLIVLIVLYVVATSALIYNKQVRYIADYHRDRAKPKQSPFERFEDRRELPPSPRQQQQLQRLQEIIERRQERERNQPQ